jgi:octanoyl-[GcvH]:protein N-octanoyltransferase
VNEAFGRRPVRVSSVTGGWSAPAEMELVRERLTRLTPDDDGQLLIFQAPRTAAFSRRDSLLRGYARAEHAVAAHGFAPVIRPVGGHLAVYDEGSLVLHLCAPHPQPRAHIQARFELLGDAIASALRGLGVDARLGPVPGEYCDGKFSVNDSGRAKLAGTGQRIVGGGYLFSAVVMVQSSVAITQTLTEAYGLLGLDFAPESVGAVADTVPGVTLEEIRHRLLDALAEFVPLRTAPSTPEAAVAVPVA